MRDVPALDAKPAGAPRGLPALNVYVSRAVPKPGAGGIAKMQQRVRIGAVNYLNTKPLIHNLAVLAPEAALELDTPSRLAVRLAKGELDVALIPVIEHM